MAEQRVVPETPHGILARLAERWRAEAERLRQLAAVGQAAALEYAAGELEVALEAGLDDTVTLGVAAHETGYSTDHLSRLIRQGKLKNVGQKHAPRIRLADVPRKRARHAPLALSSPDGSLPDEITRTAIGSKLTTARRR
ncbi:MAG TPA: hypothetical protein VFW98_10070 [Gemmatimonadaceae bacterium]|nr:hypothetical protein [Gemmatimonadaceae bacterium]